MLFRQLERLRQSQRVKQWMVVTSNHPSDLDLVEACKKRNVPVFAGSLDDVLDRFYQASRQIQPEHVVRSTGDCPLVDPEILDQLISFHLDGKFDYSSNAIVPTFPDGLDCEIFRRSALETAWQEATLPSDREHVTPFLYRNFETKPRFKVGAFKGSEDHSAKRWTVDQQCDLEFVSRVYEALYPINPRFGFADILELLKTHPEMAELNQGIRRNEGYEKSLAKDPGKV